MNDSGDTLETISDEQVADYAFCPRFAYYRWVTGIDPAKDIDEDGADQRQRPMRLTWEAASISCNIDEIVSTGGASLPVVKSRPPADEVLVCVQALVLRANASLCPAGVIEDAATHERAEVAITDELVARTWECIAGARDMLSRKTAPPPPADTARCEGCAMAEACLPGEIGFLLDTAEDSSETAPHAEVRRLMPARDDRLPLHVQAQGAYISRQDENLEIRVEGKLSARVRMLDISQVCVYGNVQVTTQALRALFRRDIPVSYFSTSGWFHGMTQSTMGKNTVLRMEQYRIAQDEEKALQAARQFMLGKIKNCRTLLRRNGTDVEAADLEALSEYSGRVLQADSLSSLIGIEGAAASVYFASFDRMLKDGMGFDFAARNRRPPRDPVNAVLSYLYAVLAKDLTVACMAAGLDPYAGFCHQPGIGRPSLALDLMEEFRPLVCDSVCIRLINTGELKAEEFAPDGGGGIQMADSARRKVLAGYEQRMDTLVRHPIFDYTISYRRVLAVQTRLLARWVQGEIPAYPPFCTR